jgi:hypothetical protein
MRVLPLALLLLLSACAERWEKPGATESDSDAAQATCTAQAAEQIRPAMVWMQVQPAYWEPGETHCWTSPNGGTRCTRRPARLRPPIYDWVDVNISYQTHRTLQLRMNLQKLPICSLGLHVVYCSQLRCFLSTVASHHASYCLRLRPCSQLRAHVSFHYFEK